MDNHFIDRSARRRREVAVMVGGDNDGGGVEYDRVRTRIASQFLP